MRLSTKSSPPWALRVVIGGFVGLCLATSANADVRLHRLFTDHMILQRDRDVNVWGWADPGEKVSVQFGGHPFRRRPPVPMATLPDGTVQGPEHSQDRHGGHD